MGRGSARAAEWPCAVAGCDQLAHRHATCDQHTTELVHYLALLPARLHDLDVTLSMQDRIHAGGSVHRSHERAWPLDLRASEVADQVHRDLHSLMIRLAHRGVPERPRSATSLTLAHWLRIRLPRILAWSYVDIAHNVLRRVTTAIDEVTDRPPLVLYAGRCGVAGCDIALYAEPGQAIVHCPMCRTPHEVTRRRDAMRRDMDRMLLTLPEIVHLAGYFEELDGGRARKLLNSWRSRGKITAQIVDGHAVYPFGEMLTLLLSARRRHRTSSTA